MKTVVQYAYIIGNNLAVLKEILSVRKAQKNLYLKPHLYNKCYTVPILQ